MNYTSLIDLLQSSFAQTGTTHSTYVGDPYELWNNKRVRYISACVSLESLEVEENVRTYVFLIYCADRLTRGETNVGNCIDACTDAVEAALNFATDNGNSDTLLVEGTRQYTPFVQKFADNLAGVWTRVRLQVNNDINLCTE